MQALGDTHTQSCGTTLVPHVTDTHLWTAAPVPLYPAPSTCRLQKPGRALKVLLDASVRSSVSSRTGLSGLGNEASTCSLHTGRNWQQKARQV